MSRLVGALVLSEEEHYAIQRTRIRNPGIPADGSTPCNHDTGIVWVEKATVFTVPTVLVGSGDSKIKLGEGYGSFLTLLLQTQHGLWVVVALMNKETVCPPARGEGAHESSETLSAVHWQWMEDSR